MSKVYELYHASVESFAEFDEKFITLSETDTFVNGFWFSSDKSTSCAWKNPNYLKKCRITLSNPIEYSEMKKIFVEEYRGEITCDEFRKKLVEKGYDGVVFNEPPKGLTEKIVENGYYYTTTKGSKRKIVVENGWICEYAVDKWGNEEFMYDVESIEKFYDFNETVVICFKKSTIEILWEEKNKYWK